MFKVYILILATVGVWGIVNLCCHFHRGIFLFVTKCDRGERGVKKCPILRDVIYEWSHMCNYTQQYVGCEVLPGFVNPCLKGKNIYIKI